MPLACGESALSAVPAVSAACRAHSLFCEEAERILFISPAHLTARLLPNGTTQVRWRYTSRGWRAPSRLVRLQGEAALAIGQLQDGRPARQGNRKAEHRSTAGPVFSGDFSAVQFDQHAAGGDHVLRLVPGLKYSLVFQPSGPGLPQGDDVGVVSAELALLSLSGEEEEGSVSGGGWGGFVSEVGLVASVDWAGAIRVEWRLGRAAGSSSSSPATEPVCRLATSYRLTLRIGEGKYTSAKLLHFISRQLA